MLTKHSLLPLFSVAFCGFMSTSLVSTAITSEELLAMQQATMAKQVKLPTKATEHKKAKRLGLFERSDILSNGTYWTYLPKNAILHIPDHLKTKIVTSPNGKLVSWEKFHAMNPAWLSKENVDIATATGAKHIDFERFQSITRRNKIIVAVHKNSPISISSRTVQKDPTLASK